MVDKNIRGNKINKFNIYCISLLICEGKKSIFATVTLGPHFIAFELCQSDDFPSFFPTSLFKTYAITNTP